MKKQRGFTLIELMVTLALISILTSIPVVFMPYLQYNARCVRGQRVMQGLVREARDLALANRSFVRIRIATVGAYPMVILSQGRCPIGQSIGTCASCPAGADCTNVLKKPIIGLRNPYALIDITSVPALPRTITFNPWGTYVEGTPLGVTFGTAGAGKRPRSITVSPAGVAKATQ